MKISEYIENGITICKQIDCEFAKRELQPNRCVNAHNGKCKTVEAKEGDGEDE